MSLTPQIDMDVQSHDWSRARSDVLKLIQQQPGNAKAEYFLAQIDVRMHNNAEARDALAKANNLDPSRSFVGNFTEYNHLSGYLNASLQVPMAYNATTQVPARQHDSNAGPAIAVSCAVLLVLFVVMIVVMARNARKRAERSEERLRESLAAARRESHVHHTTTAAPGATRSPFHVDERYVAPPAPRYYGSPAPAQTVVHTGGGGSDMLTGILVGEMLSDHGSREVIREREVYRDSGSSSSSSFDYGSSSSSSSDYGSSSSFDFGSSSSDSSSFGGGGDW